MSCRFLKMGALEAEEIKKKKKKMYFIDCWFIQACEPQEGNATVGSCSWQSMGNESHVRLLSHHSTQMIDN